MAEWDYEVACDWWKAHGRIATPLRWLPATGIVISDQDQEILMFWMYFDTTSPVCFIDNILSRPESHAIAVRDACLFAFEGPMKDEARINGATVLLGRCVPALARFCIPMGWALDERNLVSVSYSLEQEEVFAA